jgi:hypothetical protein
MKVFRLQLISLAMVVGLALGNSALVSAQDQRPERGHRNDDGDRDRDHDRDDRNWQNSAAYQDGLKFGRQDAEHHKNNHQQHKRWKSDNDRRAYEAGYNRGYQEASGNRNDRHDHDNDGYRNGNGYPNGGYGNRGNVSGNPGYNMGYQDGTNDGRADRQAGRPFKYGPGYNHPDRGYNNSLGDKGAYEQQYRIGYQQAYQQAYGRRG